MGVDAREIGNISEWNEGNLKSLRLHEAQSLMNYSKINPLRNSPDGLGWNYQLWISSIDILYDEGNSKYSTKEINEIVRIKKIVALQLKFRPTHSFIVEQSRTKKTPKFILNEENWSKLKEMIELYEQRVKYFNDQHGLSTRNKSAGGLFS